MSDSERGRDKRKKKRGSREKEDIGPLGMGKTTIILTKPDRDRERDRLSEPRFPVKLQDVPPPQPTSILKPREGDGRALSPSQSKQLGTLSRREPENQEPVYQLVQKTIAGAGLGPVTVDGRQSEKKPLHQILRTRNQGADAVEAVHPLAPPPEMKGSLKLIDESLQFCGNVGEFLLDQTDYLVIGCLGLQGSGKSSIMSLLAGNKPGDPVRKYIFHVQSEDQLELAEHGTSGVDVYVTPERVILLDSQPVLSASVMDRAMQLEKKYSVEYSSTENMMEIQSLQLAAFLLTVCHVILIIQDWFTDPNLLRFLQTAEMLKPSTPSGGKEDDPLEYFPSLVFVQNHAQPSDFTPDRVRMMQDLFSRVVCKSHLSIQSGIGVATGQIMTSLSPHTCGDPINLFLIPNEKETGDGDRYCGHPGFESLLRSMRNQIFGIIRSPLTHTTLSEKNWLHYASRSWENVKKSTFFLEYSRLLP